MDDNLVPYLTAALEALQDIAKRPAVSDRMEENLAILAREAELRNHWLEKISVSLEAILITMERTEAR